MKLRIQMFLEKKWINLKGDILPAPGTDKINALALYHNLWDLMLEASCSLELSEMVVTNHRDHEEAKEGMTSASSKKHLIFDMLMESMRTESRPCSKSSTAWSKKEYSLHPGSSGKWVSVHTCPWEKGRCLIKQESTLSTRYREIHQPDTQAPHQNHYV